MWSSDGGNVYVVTIDEDGDVNDDADSDTIVTVPPPVAR
jgi:hypothetical protein